MDTRLAEAESLTTQFNWWLIAYAFVSALLVLLPRVIVDDNIDATLLSLLAAAVFSLAVLLVAILRAKRHGRSVVAMLLVYCCLSCLIFFNANAMRTAGRWVFESKVYKRQVLLQPEQTSGQLKHMEWEGWGFPGAGDTTVYLVFDPSDALSAAAKNHSPGKYPGLPCEVVRVRRLEKYWYTALFYTDTDWDHCA